MAYDAIQRRIATGIKIVEVASLLGGVYSYDIVFDNALPDAEYALTASLSITSANPTGALNSLSYVGYTNASSTGCKVWIKSQGLIQAATIKIDVIAARRLIS